LNRAIVVHGHFYQPPRENPWLESVEVQDSAAPHHDWNERVTDECYAPNTAARRVDEANKGWAWGSPNVTSWYKNEFGRVSQNWPFGLIDYWRATLAPNPDDFVLTRQPEPVA
jgi:hypothetical protein